MDTAVPEALQSLESIRALKYAYFRLLDTKRFTELGELLTTEVTTSYSSGELSFTGRQAVVDFLVESLGPAEIVTMHHGHHPEIALHGPDQATGTWYLEDRVIVPGADFEIHGTAIYSDRYRRVDGAWLIDHTGYERVFEQHRRHSTGALLEFRTRFTEV
jgi:hypothetical protein